MAEYNLGTARAKIVIDASGAATVLIDTEKNVTKFAKSVDNTNDTLVRSGAAIGGAGAVIAGGFALAIKSAADFQSELNGIKAVSGATTDEMEKIRAKALQLGKDTKFSASEAAQAMAELAKAGVSTTDIINGAADATVALAAAGSISLPEAATISANAMNAFGLSAAELPKVADLIAGAANASAIDVSEFGFSLQQSGAVAHLAGLSFADTAVAIAELGNAGIKGSDAGTSLKTFLQNLIPVTDKEKTLFKELGLVTKDGANQFFDAAGKAKSFADISQVLGTALKGMTEEQKLATLSQIFGSDASRAAAVFASQGAEGFNTLAASMKKVSAADTAKTRMEGLNGSIEQLKGSVETMAIQIGTPLLGSINKVVTAVTSLVNKFLELSPTTQKIIASVIGLIGAFSLFAGGALITLGAVGKAIVGFKELVSVMPTVVKGIKAVTLAVRAQTIAFLTNPIFLIIAAVIALGVALFIAYKKFEPFRKAVDAVGRALKTAFFAVVSFFKDVPGYVGDAVKFIKDKWNEAPKVIEGAFRNVGKFFSNLGKTIAGGLQSAGQAVLDWFAKLPGLLLGFATGILSAVGGFLAKLPGLIAYWLGFAIGFMIRFQIEAIQTFVQLGVNVIEAIVGFFSRLPGYIWDFLVAAYNFMVDFNQKMTDKAIEVGTAVLNAIIDFFSKLPGRIWDFLVAAYNFVTRWVSNMVSSAIELGSRFINTVIDWFSKLPGRIGDFMSDMGKKIQNAVQNASNGARDLGKGVFDGVVDFIKNIPEEMGKVVDKAIAALTGAVSKAYNAAKNLGGKMWDGFKDGLGIHSPSFIEKAMTNIKKNVIADTNSLARQMKVLNDQGRNLSFAGTTLGSSGGSTQNTNNVTVNFDISGVDNPEQVKKAVASPSVLSTLINAARAGSRR